MRVVDVVSSSLWFGRLAAHLRQRPCSIDRRRHFHHSITTTITMQSTRLTSHTTRRLFLTPSPIQHRTLFNFLKSKSSSKSSTPDLPPPIIGPNDLFHPLSQSPFKEMQAKGDRIKQLAFCPVSLDAGVKTHVAFECPDCGFPTHATKELWEGDAEKDRYWPRLREANEDEHDLRSGREMTEFKLPGALKVSSIYCSMD